GLASLSVAATLWTYKAIAAMAGLGCVAQIRQEQQLVAHYSVPNQLGIGLGLGGITPAIRVVAGALFAGGLAWQLWRAARGADWVVCAGWAMLGALVTSAWLTPWYVVWVVALAAIAPERRLRAATLGFCAYVMLTRTGHLLLG
ncbi:MAG: hypothetical protein QOG42_373, partial [Solirubrobacteraceae bacterium]|nr:hypothetical protein [Solirubrobacteraceae bacterium]